MASGPVFESACSGKFSISLRALATLLEDVLEAAQIHAGALNEYFFPDEASLFVVTRTLMPPERCIEVDVRSS